MFFMGISYRSLEFRIHFFGTPIQAAFAAAMRAEGKCSTLGAELIKVIRVLASSKKEVLSQTLDANMRQRNFDQQMKKKTDRGSRSKLACPNSFRKGSVSTVKGSHYTDHAGSNPKLRDYKRPCYVIKGPTKHA